MRGNNYLKYFRYTLDDLKKSSDRKLFDYISFFAGGGGSSAGYKLAGGDCKFVNEFQQVAVDTYLQIGQKLHIIFVVILKLFLVNK